DDAPKQGARECIYNLDPSARWGHKFDRLARGMRVALDGPFGTFTFPSRPHERRFLFVAGGTGIATVRSMIKHIEIAGIPGRARLLYSARTPSDFPYLRELRGLVWQGRLELSLTATSAVGAKGAWRAGGARRARAP